MMENFSQHKGIVAPLDRANVDTDLIIPKQFLKSVERTGFGSNLFDQLRYLDEGNPGMDNSARPLNKNFILNQKRYKGATILLTRENFGCGSSREHAPWALADFGFRVIIAPSFADIFFNNCFKNGILPLTLPAETVETLFAEVWSQPGYALAVDLDKQKVATPGGRQISFAIDSYRKHCLAAGIDDIGLTLQSAQLIKQYEMKRRQVFPWLFADMT